MDTRPVFQAGNMHPTTESDMRGMKTMWGAAAWMAILVSAAPAQAQEARTTKEVQVSDLRTMKDKFVGLANAFPEDLYEWRPMEGVRSVKDVLGLMVAETYVFPPMWGAEPPAGKEGGFREHMERAAPMSRGELIAELEAAFDYAIAAVEGLDESSMNDEIAFFRSRVPRSTAIMMGTGDAHEHLGQLIAYARMNEIVPPWSRSGS